MIKKIKFIYSITFIITCLFSCKEANTKIDTETKKQSESTEIKDTILTESKDTIKNTETSIKDDLTYCFSKALAINSAFVLKSDYKKGENIQLSEKIDNKNIQRIMKVISKKTNDFQIKKFPKTITIGFEIPCEHTEYEWQLTINDNKEYTLKYSVCQMGDLSDEHCAFLFDLNHKHYTANYEFWRIAFDDEREYEKTTSYKIENDKIINIKISKSNN